MKMARGKYQLGGEFLAKNEADVQIVDIAFDPVGNHVSGPDISTAATLTSSETATQIMIQALDQNVRYTLAGSTPTASVGFVLTADAAPIILPVGPNATLKVIEEAATASLQYQWGK